MKKALCCISICEQNKCTFPGFKDELAGVALCESLPEFGIVQDADRLDAIGAIGTNTSLFFSSLLNSLPALMSSGDSLC